MRVLVVIFGGLDYSFLEQWECLNLRQAEFGRVVVDELWNQRDVATQITAQLITGKTWRENGVNERKRRIVRYRRPSVQWLEEKVFQNIKKGRRRREDFYQGMGWIDVIAREFLKDDLLCPTLFEVISRSKAVYVPAYNPEPSWTLDRNILDPRRYPELGVEAALDLREKNFSWRRRRFMEELKDGDYQLLIGQFQYIDSTQHLYISYHEQTRMDEVEAAYWRMDGFAAEVLKVAEEKYDQVLFISDNGAARKIDYKPTHHNRPFYSLKFPENIGSENNLREFYHHIIRWVARPPQPGVVCEP